MLLRRRLAVVVVAAMVALTMLALSAPAFAQGGCQAFGVQGVSDQARNAPGGMGGLASFFGPLGEMDDIIHENQEEFCPGS